MDLCYRADWEQSVTKFECWLKNLGYVGFTCEGFLYVNQAPAVFLM